MSSPQGRTGTILDTTFSPDGRLFYVKQNMDVRLTDIEFRIYTAAQERLGEQYPIPEVFRWEDPTIILVEDVGESLEHILHRPCELQQTREQFTAFLTQNLQVRGALNSVINQTLTVQDQQFLMEYNRAKLLASVKKIAPDEKGICAQDMEAHFWAYRVMNALGVYDEQFKAAYTAVIGSKIDGLLAKRGGTWLQDNCLRNNASPDGKLLIPFDFNSLQYGLQQMDETGMTGLYLFNGMLAVYDTSAKREEFMTKRAQESGCRTTEEVDEYMQGYVLSVIHQNALLAGYRTQEARLHCEELLEQKKQLVAQKEKLGGYRRETYDAFRRAHDAFLKAHDEIEYQHSACIEPMRQWNGVVDKIALNAQEREHMRIVDGFITHYTFGQRLPMRMQVGF